MATIAMDSQASGHGARPPISLHPAFPVVVALWFSALLGLGSLVLPVILLETAIDASGLASAIPAASPPLGFTARAMIALAAALLGAVAGLVIARRLAQGHSTAAPCRPASSKAAERRRPISAHDELGEEGLGGGALSATRRRSLAIAEDDSPSEYLSLAPLPGEHAFDHDALPESEPAPPAWAVQEPLELSEIAADYAEPAAHSEGEPVEFADDAPFAWELEPSGGTPALGDTSRKTVHAPDERRSGKPGRGPGGMERRLFDRPSDAEPLPFSAPSLARRAPDSETMTIPEQPCASEAAPSALPPAAPQSFDPPVTAADAAATAADWSSAPLEGLGLVQLVQRLGASLEKRREVAARAAAAPQARDASRDERTDERAARSEPGPELFEAAPAEEAAQATAAYFGRPAAPQEPAAAAAPDELAPVLRERMAVLAATSLEPEDEEEAESLAASFALPLRRPAEARPADPAEATPEPVDDDGGRFGSLLDLSNPFAGKREEFVRVDEPAPADPAIQPTVVFPGREPSLRGAPARPPVAPDPSHAARMFDPPTANSGAKAAVAPKGPPPADADEALRKALATLQRMSTAG